MTPASLDVHTSYVRDLFFLIRERAAKAQRDKVGETESVAFHAGREMAFIEVLLMMQSQADSFMISRSDLGIDGFDPTTDSLDPST